MSFSQFKNNTQILKKFLLKMNSVTQCQIKPQWIQQNFLKQNNPHVFLQLLHYIIIKFSPSVLFVKVLDYYPTIKDDNDKKFVTNVMSLARKMFDIDVKIDIDQILSSKFVQKKTQLTSSLCKAAYQYHLKENKSSASNSISSINAKKQNNLSTHIPTKLSNKYEMNDEDSEDQGPRNLNIAPSTTKRAIVNKRNVSQSDSDEDLKQLMNKRKQLNKMKQTTIGNKPTTNQGQLTSQPDNSKKGNVFPKNIKQKDSQSQNETINYLKQSKQQIKKTINKYHKQVINSKPLKQQQIVNNNICHEDQNIQDGNNKQPQIDLSQYVTRQQFMEIVTGMTRNFTQLLTKFNDFQSQVGTWVQNVNAKISILQENVKTIKNNL